MTFVLRANTPHDALTEVCIHFDREYATLQRRAALTTGRQRKELEALAAYAAHDLLKAKAWKPEPV